ncbi:MAG: ATP-binding protein [Rhodothermales bacterium]|nr:ATP-binding protein [Rhodothermales bacterium]
MPKDKYLQLDDVVALERHLPGEAEPVSLYGIVTQVIARHEGARFDSDVYLIEEGVLPAEVTEVAEVLTTRIEPELFVPPRPGEAVRLAVGDDRDQALFFDGMEERLIAGSSRDGQPVFVNLEFLDGRRGAHVNISGVSGVATKTTYATFLLYSLFNDALGAEAMNSKAIIFNVKGEDLLFLDQPNSRLDANEEARYSEIGLMPGAFGSVEFWAPPRPGHPDAAPDVSSRDKEIGSFFWTLSAFCEDQLLPFLFADAGDDRQQYTIVVHNVAAQLRERANPQVGGGVSIDGREFRTFDQLIEFIHQRLEDDNTRQTWAGQSIGQGTINAFIRRLHSARRHIGHLIRGDIPHPENHRIERQSQVTVIDIHNLHDRAKRFVVGVTLQRAFEEKERTGQARPLLFVVLDELNKYAPREGSSPIKEILLDVAERGRSLGIILLGAQQTASEVERRVIANSAIRVVGRLDSAEAQRSEYGFLPPTHRQRATIAKPGTMILSQPELPIPLVIGFPFPAWATRPSEVAPRSPAADSDPFEGLEDA